MSSILSVTKLLVLLDLQSARATDFMLESDHNHRSIMMIKRSDMTGSKGTTKKAILSILYLRSFPCFPRLTEMTLYPGLPSLTLL